MMRRFSVVLVLIVRDDFERVLLFLLYAARSSLPLHGRDICDQLWRRHKQWKTESEDVFKIQQQRCLIQNPATESEDVFKIQQQRCLIQNPAREREDVFKIQQER